MDYRAVCLDVCELAREAGAYIARQRERFTFSDVEFKGAQNLCRMSISRPNGRLSNV